MPRRRNKSSRSYSKSIKRLHIHWRNRVRENSVVRKFGPLNRSPETLDLPRIVLDEGALHEGWTTEEESIQERIPLTALSETLTERSPSARKLCDKATNTEDFPFLAQHALFGTTHSDKCTGPDSGQATDGEGSCWYSDKVGVRWTQYYGPLYSETIVRV